MVCDSKMSRKQVFKFIQLIIYHIQSYKFAKKVQLIRLFHSIQIRIPLNFKQQNKFVGIMITIARILNSMFNKSGKIVFQINWIWLINSMEKQGLISFDLKHQNLILMNKLTRFIFLSFISGLVTTCHYSCTSCTGPQYISCLNCTSDGNFTVVQNTSETPSIYWSSVYNTGTCVPTLPDAANKLGIVVFVLVIVITLFFRTKESFYLLLTLQSYGLYNLLQVAWVNPIGYLLQGLQHFMIFNTVNFNQKTQDYLLVASKNYRIHSFLGTTNLNQNLAVIAPFTLVLLVLLVIIAVISLRKKKQSRKLEIQQKFQQGNQQFQSSKKSELQQNGQTNPEEQKQCCECWRTFTEQVLVKLAKFLLSILFLMVQQTMFVLLVTLVYQVPVNGTAITLSIIYLKVLLFAMAYCYYYRVQYFKQKKIMYLTFAYKIIMPIIVVAPIKYQFIFFALAIAFVIVQFIFDKLNGLYDTFNRLLIYKVSEALTVISLTAYYIVEKQLQVYASSKTAATAATFFIALNLFLFFGVQLPLSIKQKYFSKKQEEENNNMVELLPNQTMNTIQEKQKVQQEPVHVVDLQNDLEDSSDDQNKNKREQPTIDGNSIVASFSKPVQKAEDKKIPEAKPSPPPKKKRKQIIDPQLRLRYGI